MNFDLSGTNRKTSFLNVQKCMEKRFYILKNTTTKYNFRKLSHFKLSF